MKTRIILFAFLLMNSLALQAQTIMNIHQSNGTVLQIPLNTIDSITYTVPNPGNLATLTTLTVGNITSATATSGGNITNNGGSPVTQRGVVWSTSANPTTANNTTNDGSGTGSFSSNLVGLTNNTAYYVRAYATNSAGTAYGNQVSFTTGGGIITNPGSGVAFNGYNYTSIVLGNGQEWMAENLRTTVYANGDPIPNVTDATQWSNLTTGAWVHYNNDNQYENPYGKLYNWHTVTDARNVCPTGWHVPTDAEYTLLTDYLGGQAVAGGKMKNTGTQYWQNPNTDATNQSGFSGLPGGCLSALGTSVMVGTFGLWWSSTEFDGDPTYGFYRTLFHTNGFADRSGEDKRRGFSVRCLKD